MAMRADKRTTSFDKATSRPVQSRAILVTGAGGLLGQRLVERLLESGHNVAAVYRTKPVNVTTSGLLSAAVKSGQLLPLTLDLLKAGAVQTLLTLLRRNARSVEGLVHCARSRANLPVEGLPTNKQWVDEYTLGVTVAHELVNRLADETNTTLRRVVLVGSMYGVVAVSPHLYPTGMAQPPVHYGVAKAALVHLTKELAVPLAARGINVNAVSIGGIEGRTSAAFKRRYRQLCPQGKMLNVDSAVGPIEFLLSEAASGVVGHNLVVDGGWSIW